MPLTPEEQQAIHRQVVAVEASTGAQILAAVVDRSDAYPEVPWKAFALGVAAGAGVFLLKLLAWPHWPDGDWALAALSISLGAGLGLALLATAVRPLTRLLVGRLRAEAEVTQYAEGLFLRHELFRTRRRIGVLLLASELERRLVILPDSGVRERLEPGDLDQVIALMRPALGAGRVAEAFGAGLEALKDLLRAKGFTPDGQNEIAESLVQEESR